MQETQNKFYFFKDVPDQTDLLFFPITIIPPVHLNNAHYKSKMIQEFSE